MPAIPSWEDDPDAWDTLVLGGVKLPGVVIPDAKTMRDLDVQKAKGKKKATIQNKGDPPRKITFDWIIGAQHWAEAQEVMGTIDPRKETKTLQPLELVHPVAAFFNIRTVLVEEIAGPKFQDGVATFKLELIEYEKPEPAAGVGGSAKGSASAKNDQDWAYLNHKLMQIDAAMDAAAQAGDEQEIIKLQQQKNAIINQMHKPSAKGPAANA